MAPPAAVNVRVTTWASAPSGPWSRPFRKKCTAPASPARTTNVRPAGRGTFVFASTSRSTARLPSITTRTQARRTVRISAGGVAELAPAADDARCATALEADVVAPGPVMGAAAAPRLVPAAEDVAAVLGDGVPAGAG